MAQNTIDPQYVTGPQYKVSLNEPVDTGTGVFQDIRAAQPNYSIYQSVPSYLFTSPAAAAATVTPPVEPVSQPTYEKANANFGTIRHIDPVRDQLINAFLTLENLRLFAADSPGTEEPLLIRVENYLKQHMGDAAYQQLLQGLGVSIAAEGDTSLKPASFIDPKLKASVSARTRTISARFFRQELPRIGETTSISLDDITADTLTKGVNVQQNTHSALFSTGRVMTDDIRTMEALRQALVKVRRDQQQMLEKMQSSLSELETRIDAERSTLTGLEASRAETLDDYSVAQRLLAEHWQDIEAQYAERKRIIDSHVGLYYVRVRETPLSLTLPDPLDLRFGAASDLVPGCANTGATLVEELQPFMQTLLDLPAADWAALSGLASFLPGRLQLEQLVKTRRQLIDMKNKEAVIHSPGQPLLTNLLMTHQVLMQSIAARPFTVTGLRDMQIQGHRILALEDLLVSPIPALRDPASQLQQSLTSAAGCLLTRLRAVRPSIRLNWAELAGDNRLVVESPERWPGLDKAEADDFNNLRTLVELVQWWFRQLASQASGESRTAVRNFIRACLLLAASDDPQQLLQGQLQALPSRFRLGELLRLQLNREPSPGNLLHLLDDRQQVIASLRVEDHDDRGTVASIATIINPGISLNLAMRVIGQRS